MNDLASIITNVKSFQDVQRALEELKKNINIIQEKQNPSSDGNESQSDGDVGSIRVISNNDEDALFEIKTKEGWKRPVVGNTPVTFGEVKSISKTKTKRSIDEIEANDIETEGNVAKKTIFDEKADKFILSRPDYKSDWIKCIHTTTRYNQASPAVTYEHNLGVYPSLIQIQIAPEVYNSDISGASQGDIVPESDIDYIAVFQNPNLGSSSAGQYKYGITYIMNESNLYLRAGNATFYNTADNMLTSVSGGGTSVTDAAIRVLMWK